MGPYNRLGLHAMTPIGRRMPPNAKGLVSVTRSPFRSRRAEAGLRVRTSFTFSMPRMSSVSRAQRICPASRGCSPGRLRSRRIGRSPDFRGPRRTAGSSVAITPPRALLVVWRRRHPDPVSQGGAIVELLHPRRPGEVVWRRPALHNWPQCHSEQPISAPAFGCS